MARRGKRNPKLKSERRRPAPIKPKRKSYGFLAGFAMLVGVLVFLGIQLFWIPKGWPVELAHGSAKGFNVLVITLDTTRADRLGCYGRANAQTPTLDALSNAGIRFDDAVTTIPVTLPAHATIFTGLNPPQHGVRHNGEFHLAQDHETLAEVLQGRGYETAAFVSAFVLDGRFGLDQGFDRYDDDVSIAPASVATTFSKPIYERSAGRVTSAALEWLQHPIRQHPFFCWVHYFDPHAPYQPPSPYDTRFRRSPYEGELAYMDSQIGRLLDGLRKDELLKKTLILVVADHGESLGEHNEATHAKLIYESTMHVPLIVSCPTLFPGPAVVDHVVVSIADIFPTVLDLLDIEPAKPLDGMSLRMASKNEERAIYMETLAPYLDNGWSPLFGLRRHYDKYILAPRPEYYDLEADPQEQNNLLDGVSASAPESQNKLAAKLSTIVSQSPALGAVVQSAQSLDEETIRRLEALGYVGTIALAGDHNALLDPKDMMSVGRQIDRAKNLALAGLYEEALKLLKQASVLSPRDTVLLFALARTCLFMDRIAEAESVFRTIHSIRPSARVCIGLAQIMLADGRLEEAVEQLAEAERLDPHHGGIYLARGDLLASQARPEEAIQAYEYASKIDPYRAAAEARARVRSTREFMQKLSPP